jgi:flavodoxin
MHKSFITTVKLVEYVKALIIYDSVYGSTEEIAKAITGAITCEVRTVRVAEASPADVRSTDLLIVGSPTHGGRPTPAIQGLLDGIADSSLNNIRVAAFDTRLSGRLVGIFGYASGKIADALKAKGGTLVPPPEGFFVKGKKGPLVEGELERAAQWAKGIE